MSETPTVAAKKPAMVELEEGKSYFWCSCGQSKKQPFCDGSHKGTSFTPLKVTAEESKRVAMCQCKASGNGAFCDGSHAKLD